MGRYSTFIGWSQTISKKRGGGLKCHSRPIGCCCCCTLLLLVNWYYILVCCLGPSSHCKQSFLTAPIRDGEDAARIQSAEDQYIHLALLQEEKVHRVPLGHPDPPVLPSMCLNTSLKGRFRLVNFSPTLGKSSSNPDRRPRQLYARLVLARIMYKPTSGAINDGSQRPSLTVHMLS